jgi:LmbE family N-acetylglucosaminyl deacetylase
MVMSGSDERVVFVCARPGDEALVVGGTIARLRSENACVVLLFAPSDSGDGAASAAASAELAAAAVALDVTDWRMLPAASAQGTVQRGLLVGAITEVLREVRPTALVIATAAEPLRDAATAAAGQHNVPVFLSRRMSDDVGKRLTAIDVSDEVEQKARAVAAYSSRWRAQDGAVMLPDGALQAITGTETYLRVEPTIAQAEAEVLPPTGAARVATAGFSFLAGVLFGALGTVAHQATLSIGALTLPVGLVLALVGSAALLLGLRMVLPDRAAVLAAALGLLGTIFVLSLRSTGGSVLVPAGLVGTLWTVVPALVAALAVAWPKLPTKR